MHRRHDHTADAERLQRRERHRQHYRGTVWIRYDLALPSALALLLLNQAQMISVDLRHQQRHVLLHAMIARVRDYDVSGGGESPLDLSGHGSVHGRKNEPRTAVRLRLRHNDLAHARRHHAAQPPRRGFPIGLARRTVARPQPREIEPRMAAQKVHKLLAHHSRGAEDTNRDSFIHCRFNCLTSF